MEWELVRPPPSSSNGRALRWKEGGVKVELLVDYFPANSPLAKCLILTHCHEDHRRGIELAMRADPERTLYCTELTKVLLLAREPAMRALADRITVLPTPHEDDHECDADAGALTVLVDRTTSSTAQLRAIPAGHCAGSAAVLVSAAFGVALFTGDLRWDDALLPAASPDDASALFEEPPSSLRGWGAGRVAAHWQRAAAEDEALPARLLELLPEHLDLLVLDTTCADLPLARLGLPSRERAIMLAVERAVSHAESTPLCQRIWVDVSTLGQVGAHVRESGRALCSCGDSASDARSPPSACMAFIAHPPFPLPPPCPPAHLPPSLSLSPGASHRTPRSRCSEPSRTPSTPTTAESSACPTPRTTLSVRARRAFASSGTALRTCARIS
jgi:glyoxylase-like metal-dependent hydrolase (beta-lactamase superfamily II)